MLHRFKHPAGYYRKFNYEDYPGWLYRLQFVHHKHGLVEFLAVIFGHTNLIPMTKELEFKPRRSAFGTKLRHHHFGTMERNGNISELDSSLDLPELPAGFRINFDEYFDFCGPNPDMLSNPMKSFLEMKLEEIRKEGK